MNNLQKNFEKNGYVIIPGDKILIEKLRNIAFSVIQKNKKMKVGNSSPANISKVFNNFHKYVKTKI